jgi:chromosome partitioning protein
VTRILAITNQKGGVGKTTTGVNLAASLAAARRRTLLVDLDPQGNATMGSGVEKRNLAATVYQVLLGEKRIADVRVRSEQGEYDLIPANRDLAGAEVELVEIERRETRLKDALAGIAPEYDFILIDCPPALNLLTVNGLAAAQAVIIPMQCEYYALEGPFGSRADHQAGARALEPRARDRGAAAHHVRSAQYAAPAGFGAADRAFRRQGLPHGHPEEHPPRGGAEPRHAGAQVRAALEGREAYLALAGEMLNREAATQ